MEIIRRDLESIPILHLKGSLTFGDADLILQEEIEKAIRTQTTRLVLDFGEVTEIDSTCSSTLLAAQEQLKALGGGVALACVNPARLNPTEVERLETAFEPFEFVEDAVNAFFPNRRVKHFDIRQLVESGDIARPAVHDRWPGQERPGRDTKPLTTDHQRHPL